VAGSWKLTSEGLTGAPEGGPARLTIPVLPEGNYDLLVEFTRATSFLTVGVILPVGERQCLAAFNFRGGPSGLDMIDNRRASNNSSTFAGALANDRKYAAEISVRTAGQDAAVTVKLDGRPLLFYRGPVSSLELAPEWRIPHGKCIGLGTEAGVLYHSVQLKMVAGQAKIIVWR
jgi:hypothetical protein